MADPSNRLHQRGLIADPKNKNKSVIFTGEGRALLRRGSSPLCHEDTCMIIRSWKAVVLPKNVEAYAGHFRNSVLPALRRNPGHKGAYLLKKNGDAGVDLIVLTLWETMESIHKFAGNAADEAVVEPAAQAVLASFDRKVQHYEVVLSSVSEPQIRAS
jgi:heme-degrading monooxygenase HmoA